MYSATKEILIFSKRMEKLGIKPKSTFKKVVDSLTKKLPVHVNWNYVLFNGVKITVDRHEILMIKRELKAAWNNLFVNDWNVNWNICNWFLVLETGQNR